MRRSEEGLKRQAALRVPFIKDVPEFYIRNNVSYALFPNAVLLAEPMGLFLQLFWPDGVGRTRMDGYFIGRDWGEEARPRFWDSYLPIMNRVVEEDIENLAPMQFSMESGAFTGVMTNYNERRLYWFHEEIDRRIGPELPSRFALKPILEPYGADGPLSFDAPA